MLHKLKDLISPKWIKQVSWNESEVYLSLSREQIKKSPEYKAQSQFHRSFETEVHKHYNQVGYWTSEQATQGEHDQRSL